MKSRRDTHDLLSQLGIDIESFRWQELASCNGAETNWFFDDYESSPVIARQVDNMCLGCPVIAQCYNEGVRFKETGVRGGFYLMSGKPDKNRNRHKSQELVMELAKRIHE